MNVSTSSAINAIASSSTSSSLTQKGDLWSEILRGADRRGGGGVSGQKSSRKNIVLLCTLLFLFLPLYLYPSSFLYVRMLGLGHLATNCHLQYKRI